MACLECGLEQPVGDAGTCARCGAPLPGAGHRAGTFTARDGAELRADDSGIHVRGTRDARARLISWEEIGWFRDGWHAPDWGKPGWMLDIVLADGRLAPVTETWSSGRKQAPPELLALIRVAAEAHSVPAVLTGGQVHAGLPGKNAGLYYDPAGEPGLREWTGTEWSPFLQVDPAASGHPGQETGLASIWSPLSAAERHRQSREILQGARSWIRFYAFSFVFYVLVLAIGLGVVVEGDPAAGAIFVALGVAGLALCVPLVRQQRTSKRIALALSAAAREQDDPSIPIEPPDLRTN